MGPNGWGAQQDSQTQSGSSISSSIPAAGMRKCERSHGAHANVMCRISVTEVRELFVVWINSPRNSGDVIGPPNFLAPNSFFTWYISNPAEININVTQPLTRLPTLKRSFQLQQQVAWRSAVGARNPEILDVFRRFSPIPTWKWSWNRESSTYFQGFLFATLICLYTLLSSDSSSENLENWLCVPWC